MSILDAFRLDGQVALITGGAQHLGFDMATALGEAGADLAITDLEQKIADDSAARLREITGRDVLPIAFDQTDYAQVEAAARKAFDWKGRIDVLLNNAGGGFGKSTGLLFERSAEDIHNLININLVGMLYCCKAFGKLMADRKSGRIINIGSIAGIVGRDRRMYERNNMLGQPIDYAASKGGVIAATRDLAAYFAPMGIRVNCISPGGFASNLPAQFVQEYGERTPLGRMGEDGSNDLKGALLLLASSASEYITGHNLVVDGGFSIWQ